MAEPTRRAMAEERAQAARTARHRRIGAAVVAVVVVLAVGIGVAWWRLEGNITRLDVSGDLSSERPDAATGPLNILLVGSDDRDGQGTSDEGQFSGARSDTTLLAHLSADRQHVTVVSIPRDSMVPVPPECDADVPEEQWPVQQFNAAFSLGGPACIVNTVEAATGLFVNHFAVVDFTGFKGMVDALGGVPVCTNTAIDDPKAKLTLAAGRHVLDGEQALGYVRTRASAGGDLDRIERQQAFLSSIVQEATRTSLLLRPDRLFAFLDAATESLTTDEGLGVSEMRDIATSVKDTGIENIAFVTVPNEPYPQDPNRVQWTESADALWRALEADEPVTKAPASPSPKPSEAALTVSPDEIAVVVVNATGVDGLAREMGDALRVQGFDPVTTESTDERPDGVVVAHGPGDEEAARTVAAAFPGSTVEADAALAGAVRVTVGAGAAAVVEVPNRLGSQPLPSASVTAPEPSASIEARTADEDICS